MTTNLAARPVTTIQLTDLSSLRRMLIAAAIDKAYCKLLLESPERAVKDGFGGEDFPMTEFALEAVSNIRAKNLVDFIRLINEKIPIL
ncbi:MAG TPA: hypothetical protein PK078_12980 [Anaerolineales bacterium]|nr:hypothetical protein [Anaerolineales bacterium]